MRARLWVALAAVAFAMALLAPALTPLSGSMDAFATELANGTFRPFGQLGGGNTPVAHSGSLGGMTGSSTGNYLPGANELPRTWTLDRDGRGQQVTIDFVFNPALGAMKRLKAYDRVGADGETLTVADATLRPISPDANVRYDWIIEGSFPVQFHRDSPVAIFSPHPKAVLQSATVDPPLSGGVQFFKDGADTYYALGHVERIATLNITFRVSADYYTFTAPEGAKTSDYRYSASLPRPVVAAGIADDAALVLARAGVTDPTDVGDVLSSLTGYFRSFTEGDIPPPTEIEGLYLALALGEHGCCRHRAFAFMLTAQSVGIPTRAVVNEAHAFVEVAYPDGRWHQINLGGCGTYTVNNPNDYPNLFDASGDPRREANPDEESTTPKVPTETNITEAPTRIVKGEPYFVNGTVLTLDGRPVPGARVDVYLNATKETPGRLTGAGTTGSDGRFSIPAKVPPDAPAQGYQLVARSIDGHASSVRFGESWSDPPVDVFAPTRFAFGPLVAAAGFPAQLRGRLVDIDGAGVPNATIHWSADGVENPSVAADATGRFSLVVQFNTTGTHLLGVRYDGGAHHGAASGEAPVTVNAGAILLPPDAPLLVRGEAGAITGTVAIRGAQVGGRLVEVALATQPAIATQARTNDDGSFIATLTPLATTRPGIYDARIEVAALALNTTLPVRVAAGSIVTLAAPDDVAPGAAWLVEATVESDNGTRIVGGLVELSLGGSTSALLTNRTGVARFEQTQAPTRLGAYPATVRFAGDAEHAPASEAFTLDVARPWYAALPPWAYGSMVALLLVVAVGSALLVPGSRSRRAIAALFAGLTRPERHFLAVAFPDHPPGITPIIEPGTAARVRIVARDRKGVALHQRVALVSNGQRFVARAEGEAGALFEVKAPLDGRLDLVASATGARRLVTRPLERAVDVASYREAVEREFVRLRALAGLDRNATAGDVVERIAARVGDGPLLRRAAEMFDVADYSEARVDRSFYHSFAATSAILRDRLEARDA